MTTSFLKHICDRCGTSLEIEVVNIGLYPKDWQHLTLGQTGAELDLCGGCNDDLVTYMNEFGATNMVNALINERDTL